MAFWLCRTMKRYDEHLGREACLRLRAEALELGAPGTFAPEVVPSEAVTVVTNGEMPLIPELRRMSCIYVVGVEGTGHHGVEPMLLHGALKKYGIARTLASWRRLREVFLATPREMRRAALARLLEPLAASTASPQVIFEFCSWPYRGGDNPDQERWCAGCADPGLLEQEMATGNPGLSFDLREFVELMGVHAEVRLLCLYRRLAPATWSHASWDRGLVEHARVLAMFNNYITSVLTQLDPIIWRWVAYEDIVAAHAGDYHAQSDNTSTITLSADAGAATSSGSLAASLAHFLNLPAEALHESLQAFAPSTKDAWCDMPGETLTEINALEDKLSPGWFPALFPGQHVSSCS